MADAVPVVVPTREENGFLLTPDELRSALTFNTKALILNSPGNPTGSDMNPFQLDPVVTYSCFKKWIDPRESRQ